MLFVRQQTLDRWVEQLKQTVYEVDGTDYSFIDPYIRNKRFVVLGESSHGVGDYQRMRMALTHYLQRQHGFNVVLLENSFMEAELRKDFLYHLPLKEQIRQTMFSIYHTEEMLPLFELEAAGELTVSGIDPQRSSVHMSEHALEWVRAHLGEDVYRSMKQAEAKFFELDEQIEYKVKKTLRAQVEQLIKRYEALLESLAEELQPDLDADQQRILAVIRRGMFNRAQWLEIILKNRFTSGFLRMEYMFDNLLWIMDNLYKEEKVVLWGHNFHMMRKGIMPLVKPLGEALCEAYGEDVYVIGLFAGAGITYEMGTKETRIKLKKRNLESLLNRVPGEQLFLPLSDIGRSDPKEKRKKDRDVWFHRLWELTMSGRIYPQDHYDAILFKKQVSPPTRLQGD